MFGHPFVQRSGILRLRLAGLNLNRALWMNSHHRDRQPGRGHSLDGPGHVLLPEYGGCAGHVQNINYER
jgi:hypothetical protein